MKAAVYRRYGAPDVVAVEEVATPRPGDGEILVRVHAATVGVVDSLARRGMPWYARVQFGPLRPRFPVLGSGSASASGLASASGSASALVAVIAARYPLDRIADAYRRVDAGHKKGNVVVTMA